jgi:hypothetical protein
MIAFTLPPISLALAYDPTRSPTSEVEGRAPTLADFEKLYGLFAQTIATLTTAGYYGVAEVPTLGAGFKEVYIARVYILAILLLFLVFTPVLIILDIGLKLYRRDPLRRITFLTIANAVRGPWWDNLLWGGCLMPPTELRRWFSSSATTNVAVEVMFGADERFPQHVGLAPRVESIKSHHIYSGIRKRPKLE